MNQEILQAYLRQEETPAYIFDLDMLKSRVQMMKTILGERTEICFAMKANPFLIGPQENFTFVRQSEFQWRELYCPV